MSLGAVQKSLRRSQKLADAMAGGEPGDVVAAVCDDEVRAADVTRGPGLYYPTPHSPYTVVPPPPPSKYPLDVGDIVTTGGRVSRAPPPTRS